MRPKLTGRQPGGIETGGLAGISMDRTSSVDRAIATLAANQRGIVTRSQLLRIGLDGNGVKRRLRAGRLHPLHRGVYLVGHRALAAGALEMAAVLACGPAAAVSHESAARLWRLLPYPAKSRTVDITVFGREPARRAGINLHRSDTSARSDVRRLGGIPLTAPARTILDLAAVLPLNGLEAVVADALRKRLVRRGDLLERVDTAPRRRGVGALRRALEVERGPAPTRSEAERRMLRLVRSAGLPTPLVNARLLGFEVDFLWRQERVVVEVDGYAYHSQRHHFERDRDRDSALAAQGYVVIRVTWRQLLTDAHAVIARLASALALRSPDTGASGLGA